MREKPGILDFEDTSLRLRFPGLGDRLEGRSTLPDRERRIMLRVYTTGSASMTIGCRDYVSR